MGDALVLDPPANLATRGTRQGEADATWAPVGGNPVVAALTEHDDSVVLTPGAEVPSQVATPWWLAFDLRTDLESAKQVSGGNGVADLRCAQNQLDAIVRPSRLHPDRRP